MTRPREVFARIPGGLECMTSGGKYLLEDHSLSADVVKLIRQTPWSKKNSEIVVGLLTVAVD